MSDKIDEIIDRLIKGGRGSGRRGHKTAPVSDIQRQLNPENKKKILASDKKAVRGASKDLSHEELQSKIDGHRELSENKFLSPASRESYSAKHKALLAVQKKKGPKPEAPKEEEGISSRPGPFGNINKGGAGSGKKGHTTGHQMISGTTAQTNYDFNKKFKHAPVNKDISVKSPNQDLWHHGDIPKGSTVSNLSGGLHVKFPKGHAKENAGHREYGVKINSHESNIKNVEEGLRKGGPGSGRKGSGKIEPKHFEPNPNLRDKDKKLDRLTPEQVKARNSERDRRMKEDIEARKRGEEPNYDRPSNTAHLDKSLETLFYMKQLAEEGRLKPKQKRNMKKSLLEHLLEKGGPGSGKKGHTTNHEERNKLAADAIKGSKASEMYPLDSFMTDALDEEGGLDYMLNNEEEFNQKMVNKHVQSVGSVQPEYLKEAITYSLADIKAKLGLNKSEDLEKKQGVPKGVDPAKHERCVMDVKASGKDKSSAYAICNSSMNKVLPLAGKTIFRTIQNLVKPAGGSDGSEADKPVGGYDGASVAHGSGGAKKEKGPGKKMKKSLLDHLLEKGGIGSGRKGHHSIGRDYSDDAHDSVFEDNEFDNVGEREAYKDKMIAAANREEEKASQRIKEEDATRRGGPRGPSRKHHSAPEKKSLLQRIGQKIIDAI